MTYTFELPKPNDKCYECGQPATILLVADCPDSTGYIDEIPLCEYCLEEREK